MVMWKWQRGRQQNTEYWKFPLWYFRIFNWGFDAYMLKYKENTELNWHTDPVEGGEHHRLNVVLTGWSSFVWELPNGRRAAKLCGRFWNMFTRFRPDITPHYLKTHSPVTKLSFGFVKYI